MHEPRKKEVCWMKHHGNVSLQRKLLSGQSCAAERGLRLISKVVVKQTSASCDGNLSLQHCDAKCIIMSIIHDGWVVFLINQISLL